MAARQISGGPLISRRSPINPTAAVEGALEGQQIADIEERGTETAMDGDSADSLTWEDAAPAGVSTKQLQLKKTRQHCKARWSALRRSAAPTAIRNCVS